MSHAKKVITIFIGDDLSLRRQLWLFTLKIGQLWKLPERSIALYKK